MIGGPPPGAVPPGRFAPDVGVPVGYDGRDYDNNVDVQHHGPERPRGDRNTDDHDVTEDSNVGNLVASGQLTISDVDGPASFQAGATGAAGNLGSLTFGTDGTYTYSVANSVTQYLAASDTKTDTFTVTASDGTTQQIGFDIHGAQDAPTLLVGHTAGGLDNANIPLSISAGLVDSSSTLLIEIDGVPSSYGLNHGTVGDDGSTWTVSPNDLNTLALVPLGGVAQAGTFNLHVVATTVDAVNSALRLSAADDIAVTASLNPSEVVKHVADGYIAGATVFADANGDGILNNNEAHTTTNGDGSFILTGGGGPLVMFGGIDISTGLPFQGKLTAPAGSSVVTPLTTLISALISPTVDATMAADQVAAAFGLDTTVDLTHYDPVPLAVANDPVAKAILSAAIQVQSTVVQISAIGDSTSAVFTAYRERHHCSQ